jgi:hypothetical protein
MNQYIKEIGLLIFLVLLESQIYGQLNAFPITENNRKFTLVSTLDLLAKLPDTYIQPLQKQKSIFDVDKLPLFCKFEHKLYLKSKLNIRVRLGSLDYVNKLEGKN